MINIMLTIIFKLFSLLLILLNPTHAHIRQLQPSHSYSSTTVQPMILHPIQSMTIPVSHPSPPSIDSLLNKFKNILPNNNKQETPESKPFYCSQHRTTTVPPFMNEAAREKLVSTKYGFNMYVDRRDGIVSTTIDRSGTWEPEYIQLMGHIVKEGHNVLNLGSQSGLQALVMGKIIGPTGKLFIFEPYSFSNFLVTKNIEINNLTEITKIYKVGASDEIKNTSIEINYWNTGGSTIQEEVIEQKEITFENSEIQEVSTNLVDNLLPPEVKLNFALIDVEKMEVKALRGMKNIIARSPDLVLMVQWQYGLNPKANRPDTLEFLNTMLKKGYKIYTYMGGDYKNCKLGVFVEQSNIERILKIKFADLFFFPASVPLPS